MGLVKQHGFHKVTVNLVRPVDASLDLLLYSLCMFQLFMATSLLPVIEHSTVRDVFCVQINNN